jgi:hypothetical protein
MEKTREALRLGDRDTTAWLAAWADVKEWEAEREQLIGQITSGRAGESELRQEWLDMKAERDRLRKALASITRIDPSERELDTAQMIARAALGEQT